jgi:predicted anti-sigma-YlaC factor YlaD
MDCERTRNAMSAQIDGEDFDAPPEAVSAHVAGCPACRAFQSEARALHRTVRLAPAPRVPDLTARVLQAIGADDAPASSQHLDAWRLGLALIALVQIGLGLPALLFGTDAGLPVHAARHLGSFDIALAVGFLFAAWRPSRVKGLFPVAIALVICLFVTSVIDVASGRTAAVGELAHATELAGLALLWLVGRGSSGEEQTGGFRVVPGPA